MSRVTATEVVDRLMENDEHFKTLSRWLMRLHLGNLSSRSFTKHVRDLLDCVEENLIDEKDPNDKSLHYKSRTLLEIVEIEAEEDEHANNPGAA